MYRRSEFFRIKILKSLSKQFPLNNVTLKNLSYKQRIMSKTKQAKQTLIEKMPKKKSEKKSARYPPGEIYLSVLGNGAVSSPRALYMFTDHTKYLFNCGEGTQRLANEHKMKLSKLKDVFITHRSWENLGGLLGLSLTVQDMGVSEISIHGPPDLDLLYSNSESFVYIPEMKISINTCEDTVFSDDVMDVQYIRIQKCSDINKPASSEDSSSDSESDASEQRFKKIRLSSRIENDVIMSFACKGHSKLGQLMPEKCVELGVPMGPLLGELKNGKDITLPSGRIVYSKQVVSEEQICPLFLVVECPSEDFLDAFCSEEKFQQFQEGATDPSRIAALIVHFTPPDILNSPKYQDWMNLFPVTSCHLIINSDSPSLNSLAIHRIQHKLNLLHPQIFNLLHENKGLEKLKEKGENKNIFQTHTLDRYQLRPLKGFDRSFSPKLEPKTYIEEAMELEGFKDSLELLKKSVQQISVPVSQGHIYPEVTFLGTGSSLPSKVRNVSAIMVKFSESNYIVLDCGEGTYHQIVRCFGCDHKQVLRNTSCIFISHMHADHHLGLIKFLSEREKSFQLSDCKFRPVTLVGPLKLKLWLQKYHSTFERIRNLYRFVKCSSLDCGLQPIQSNSQHAAEISMRTVEVNHCHDAYGVVLSHGDDWKLVYSGDTRPCENLVDAGLNCDLLIHEATMEDELSSEAVTKKHSTTSEAINIGKLMNAKHTILTHFSQRYAKIPLFNDNFHLNVGCAFDNMKVASNELVILPLLIPTLKCLFAEEVEDLNTRGIKRREKLKVLESMVDDYISEKTHISTESQ